MASTWDGGTSSEGASAPAPPGPYRARHRREPAPRAWVPGRGRGRYEPSEIPGPSGDGRREPTGSPTPGATDGNVVGPLCGLVLGVFAAALSSTVVMTALPAIDADIGPAGPGYLWIVTSTLLAAAISIPVWSRLSGLVSPTDLALLALVIFAVASVVAGVSPGVGLLVTARVAQGLGAGGLLALAPIVVAQLVGPRGADRYAGFTGAAFVLGVVAGPLVGGAVTEHLSWRWSLVVGIPVVILAFLVLWRTPHLPATGRAGDDAGLSDPTAVLSSLAILCVGVGLFVGTVLLGHYFQLARGEAPFAAGRMTIPLIAGVALASLIGVLLSRAGRSKVAAVIGGVLLTAGLGLLGTIASHTGDGIVAAWMLLVGLGAGLMVQGLVVAVQNIAPGDAADEVSSEQVGAAGAFGALAVAAGGALGVAVFGAVFGDRVAAHRRTDLAEAGIRPPALGPDAGISRIPSLPEPVRDIVQHAYGQGVAEVFLLAAAPALLALVIALCLPAESRHPELASTDSGEVSATEQPTAADRAAARPGRSGSTMLHAG